MSIETVLEVLELLQMEHTTYRVTNEIYKIEVADYYNEDTDEWETRNIYYYNSNGKIIKNYEEKIKIQKQIQQLKEKLTQLEKQEKELEG